MAPVGAGEKTSRSLCDNDYFSLRCVSNFLFNKLYSLRIDGELPKERPCIVLSTHQNSLDAVVLMRGIEDYVAFVYAVSLKSRFLSWLGLTIDGIRVTDNRIFFKKFTEHLNRNSIVVAFPQGSVGFPQTEVASCASGIAKLAEVYESSKGKQVVFVPAGIEYKCPRNLPRFLPVPSFVFPCFGTSVTVRFGEPRYLDGRTPEELTGIVMREAAQLSNIPYTAAI